MVITGGQSSNKVEPTSVIVMLLSVYTHLTGVHMGVHEKGGLQKRGSREPCEPPGYGPGHN